MRNTNITNFRKKMFDFVNEAIDYNQVINISSKNGNVVILNENEYNGMIETLELMSNPKTKKQISEGLKAPDSDFVKFEW